jgi:putative N6-adenine-specific DNA methylase
LDTSGEALFKRGWRDEKGDAPLKENLAAAMLKTVGWNPAEENLLDAMCGSGTIAIEAALIACDIPPSYLKVER